MDELPVTVPASVKVLRNGTARIRCTGTDVSEEDIVPKSFWDILDSWGGEWMWELVDPEFRSSDLSWIDRAMADGTLVCCADGSYRKKVSPYVSGTGWVIQCSKSGKCIEGCFYEVSDSANAYRADN